MTHFITFYCSREKKNEQNKKTKANIQRKREKKVQLSVYNTYKKTHALTIHIFLLHFERNEIGQLNILHTNENINT